MNLILQGPIKTFIVEMLQITVNNFGSRNESLSENKIKLSLDSKILICFTFSGKF